MMADDLKHPLFQENQEIIKYLADSRLFGYLPKELLERLIPLAAFHNYESGSIVLNEGSPNDRIYFLIRGEVGVYAANQLILKLRRVGDIFGEMSIISDKVCSASVIAESRVRLFSLRSKDVGRYSDLHSEDLQNVLYRIFAKILTEKLSVTTEKAKNFEIANRQYQQTLEELKAEVQERLEGEKKLKKLNEELRIANESNKYSQMQLVQSAKLASIGELTSGIAHELNQPLSYILVGTQLELRNTPEDLDRESVYETLQMVEEGATRMMNIINHLRDFSRQSSSSFTVLLDLNAIIDRSFIMFNEQLRVHDIRVDKNYTAPLPPIFGNASQLEQVFINMIANARDALEGKKGALLTIQTKISKNPSFSECVVVSFEDNGIGIPESQIDKIFDPFFTTKEVGKGTGLGLSISYGIVKNHGGEIRVSSIEGKGTSFEVVLPIFEKTRKPYTFEKQS
ncbi:ATP-binding protein [Deltaproteobacteria bacterium TL4]